jgi:hypothetical protein
MSLLQEITDAIGSDKLKQLADGQGNFDAQNSADQGSLIDMIKRIDPEKLKEILGQVTPQMNPQEYSDHVTPGADGTDPLGKLKAGGLAAIAGILLNHLRQAQGGQQAQVPGVQTTDPNQMSPDDVAATAKYAQQNHPDAFGKAAAQIGQEQPGLLHSFLGKAAMALTAAVLAKHLIKMDRKTPK